jgi:hypothetical protein
MDRGNLSKLMLTLAHQLALSIPGVDLEYLFTYGWRSKGDVTGLAGS